MPLEVRPWAVPTPVLKQKDKTESKINKMKKLIASLATVLFTVSVFAAEFPDVSIKEVKALADSKNAVILDVNGTESYQKGRVPGALNYEVVKDKLSSVLPADKNAVIVAYCGNPKCKAYKEAAEAAVKLGYTNVKHMSAGIKGWKDAGEKLDKD